MHLFQEVKSKPVSPFLKSERCKWHNFKIEIKKWDLEFPRNRKHSKGRPSIFMCYCVFFLFALFPPDKRSNSVISFLLSSLGKPWCSIIDEFLEKFQTAFDPPPRAFFGKNVAIFCYKNFWNGNDPPKLASQMLKILQRNFLDRKWPPPLPFGTFPKIHR